MPLLTEDLGKQFEMAICLTYNIPYDGEYKYGMEVPTALVPRLKKIKELFPCPTHTARKGSRYDFTAAKPSLRHLSAKTTKKYGKVAPHVIGQSQPATLCERLHIPYSNNKNLKKYIQEHIVELLPEFMSYTFDSEIVYYNQKKNTLRYITMCSPIDWTAYVFSWTRSWDHWGNSSTLKLHKFGETKDISIMEIQFHETRTNMAIRWNFENFMEYFKAHLHIVNL
jgi:hypothetical protein